MIRKLKYIDGVTEIDKIIESNDARFVEITKEFVERKNTLTNNSTKAVDHFETLLKRYNIFYIKERCFFSEDGDLFYSDFYIPLLKLTIEIDGGYHEDKIRKYLDKVKEDFLVCRGIATIRFKNEEVFKLQYVSEELFIKNSKLIKLEGKNSISKNKALAKLKNQFFKELATININKTVVMYSKDTEWVFNNIFVLHFSTELRFKDVLKRLNNYNNKLKYNIKYLD